MKNRLNIVLAGFFACLLLPLSVTAQDIETYSHKLSQSTSTYQFWTTPPSERVFKDSAVPTASGSEVKVYAAKNESEPFQVIVKPASSGSVKVTIEDFGSGITTELYQVKYVNITQATDSLGKTGYYPDPLWPLEKGASVSLTSNQNTAFWFNIYVPKTTPSGNYTKNVQIGGVNIPVRLHVFNFAVPDELHVKSQMNFGYQTVLNKYGVSGTGDNYWLYVNKIKQFFMDHRLTPSAPLWSGGLTSNGGGPYIDYDCSNGTLTDNDGVWGFEDPAAKYLGGSAFRNKVGYSSFMAATYQNNDASADQRPSTFCGLTRGTGDWYTGKNPSSAYNKKWFQYIASLQKYLSQKGYLDKAYYYFANEPQDQADYDAVAWYSKQLKTAAPNLKLMVSEEPKPEIYTNGKIDIWLPVLNDYNPDVSYNREKNYGEETWIYFLHGTRPPYFNPITLDHPGVESKFTGWFLWKYRIRGIAYYSLNNWDKNPWTSPMTDGHNGDTFMLYPPSESNTNIAYGANSHRFAPSIRFELMRDSLEDYEYLYVLNAGKPAVGQVNSADKQADKIISGLTAYTRNSEFMYNLRRLIGMKNGNEITAIPDIQPPAAHPRAEGSPGNYYINFQDPNGKPTANPLVVNGKTYMKIGWNEYDKTLGYGWFGDMTNVKYQYLSSGPNELQKSILYDDYGKQKTFEFDLPKGTYNITVSIGWEGRNQAGDISKIDIEGVSFVNSEVPNGYMVRKKQVTVSDSKLTMNMGVSGKYTMLNYLDIEAIASSATTSTTTTTTTSIAVSTSTTTKTTTSTAVSTSTTTSTTVPSLLIKANSSQAGQLGSIVNSLKSGGTLLLADGTYNLNGGYMWVGVPKITIRSESGNREKVILDGGYVTTEILQIAASDVTISDITLKRAKYHLIHVMAATDADVQNTVIRNVHLIDPGQQAIKINQNSAKTRFADNGIIAGCRIEMTDAGRKKVFEINGSCYTGGVDAHQARGWKVYDNEIEGFWCSQGGLAEFGIHFWTGSRDTLVERNRLIDNARGIGFGLGQSGTWRKYSDNPCGGASNIGHYDGIIRNNFILQKSESLRNSPTHFDAGISLEQACGTKVLHNTIVSTAKPNISSVEWRFSNTNVEIANNAVSYNMMARDGGKAELSGNIENAALSLFLNPAGGDLHLSESAGNAIDKGAALSSGLCDEDIDGEARDATPDIGADERIGGGTVVVKPVPANLRITEIVEQ